LNFCTKSAEDPDYHLVATHARRSVFFHQAIQRLEQRFPKATFLEAGRGSSVIQLVKSSVTRSTDHLFVSPQLTTSDSLNSLADNTVQLWKAGYAVQCWPYHRVQRAKYQFLRVPSYHSGGSHSAGELTSSGSAPRRDPNSDEVTQSGATNQVEVLREQVITLMEKVSGEPIRRIDCIDKTNTEDPRGCKEYRGLYTKGCSKASKVTAGVYTHIHGCGTKPLASTMTERSRSSESSIQGARRQ
jgi:hypothetical protein